MFPLEADFLKRFDARLRRQLLTPVRFSLAVGALLFVLFGLWDWTMDPAVLAWTAPVRLLLAVGLGALYAASFTSFRRRSDALFLMAIAVAGTGVMVLGSRVPGGRSFVLASLLLLVPFVAVLASSMKAGLAGGGLLLLAANAGASVMQWPAADFFLLHLFLVPSLGAASGLAALTRRARLHAFRLEVQLEYQAQHDALSGALNRAAFLCRGAAYGDQTSVLVLDVDHFKALNDRYGHAMGDEAIRQLAAAVKAEVRETDLVGRLGGEEFGVLLPGLDGAAASAVAERVRAAVSRLVIAFGEQRASMTVSVGVAQSREGERLEWLLHRADLALYRAKDTGRDRVSSAA